MDRCIMSHCSLAQKFTIGKIEIIESHYFYRFASRFTNLYMNFFEGSNLISKPIQTKVLNYFHHLFNEKDIWRKLQNFLMCTSHCNALSNICKLRFYVLCSMLYKSIVLCTIWRFWNCFHMLWQADNDGY